MKTAVTYVVVPRTEYVILRVVGHPKNKKELLLAVRGKRVAYGKVRSAGSRMLWSKARVKKEFVRV
jgi:hypothetical protein